MDEIELKERGREEDKSSEEARERQEKEDTSFTERTEETKDDYDDIRSRINSETPTQSKTSEGFEYDEDDLSERIEELTFKKEMIRFKTIQALELATGVRFDVSYGENSKELIDNTSDVRVRKRDGVLIALKYKGEKVVLTKEGKIDKRSVHKNKRIWEAIAAANEEYEKSFDSVADEEAGLPLSDEARDSIQDNTVDELESFIDGMYDEIHNDDLNVSIVREINGIMHTDDTVDYDNLEDSKQKEQYDGKIQSLKVNTGHWRYMEQQERNPTKKQLYKTAKELCIAKKSYMEVRAGFRPESEEALSMIREEVERNDLTRFERFKRWSKENLVGVSAIAISVAGIITTVVISGRNAVKKGAKAVGQFGKALANLAKKAGPAIATILNILAQVLTWGAKALEFLSRNLWIVALFLTYLVYDTVKGRMKSKN